MDRNELDPSVPSATEVKKIPLIIKVYAALCILSGVGTLPSVAAFMWQVITALINGNAAAKLGDNTLVAVGLIVAGIMLSAASAVILIIFGLDLIKNQRRNAARLSYILIAFTVVELLVDVMLQGIGLFLLRPAIQLGILIALSATVDPTLRQERELQRRLQEMLDRDAAAEGMLGRDETGEGYIKLNYFNLFWVFFVCCILGLIAEDIWHMTVDDPGVYQNRAGMLFGPFSPIYGFGAVLMTMVLNRFYKKNPIIIFLVSALLGASFEVFVGWFMQTSFGVVSWSYSHMKLFGMPDPLAVLTGGLRLPMGPGWTHLDQAASAQIAQTHQHDSVEEPLLGYRHLHHHYAGRWRYDAAVARLLVSARQRHGTGYSRCAVLRQVLR